MHSSTGICLHLPVDANLVYTGRCFFMIVAYHLSSICRYFSRGMPAILPYFTNQSRFPGFHLPPAALAYNRTNSPLKISLSNQYTNYNSVLSLLYCRRRIFRGRHLLQSGQPLPLLSHLRQALRRYQNVHKLPSQAFLS
jgi:hypothetical protein